jgi:4-hydroxy-4-methyl-2-oxoglutarate aldolase
MTNALGRAGDDGQPGVELQIHPEAVAQVCDFACKISAGGVSVTHHDLIVGDVDGVVVIPAAVASEVIAKAEEKVSGENMVRVKLEEGMLVGEAFQRYGVM